MDQAHKDRMAELEEAKKNGTIDENGKKELEGIKKYEADLKKNGDGDKAEGNKPAAAQPAKPQGPQTPGTTQEHGNAQQPKAPEHKPQGEAK